MKNESIQKALPRSPGIYLFKNNDGLVIYIGKAKCIKTRVASYFQKQKTDWKVQALLEEHSEIDYIITKNETEALLLEAQLIRDYRPKFNVLLKEGQPFVYIHVTKPVNGRLSRLELVRNKIKKGKYFGPFLHKSQARSVHRYLVKTFKLNLCNKIMENGCLDYHIGLCAGNCKADFDKEDYEFRLQLAHDALKKNHKALVKSIKNQISTYNEHFEFEKAMHLNDYLNNLDVILDTLHTKFSESKYQNQVFEKTSPVKRLFEGQQAGKTLQLILGVQKPVSIIDCFDVSHFQSSALVGSCVRFVDGLPERNSFRKFKIRSIKIQNDYAALREIVERRYKHVSDDSNDKLPDLIVIDGGKGQLSAVQSVIPDVACISLAKSEETIFGPNFPEGIVLDVNEPLGKLLISLRDYAHHFAISYHRARRKKEFQ